MTLAPGPPAGIGDPAPPAASRRELWARYRKNRLAVVALLVVVAIIILAILADQVAPYRFDEGSPAAASGPSRSHLFGTDSLGRDILSRVMHGAGISLQVAILATLLSSAIGVAAGALSGFAGGRLDAVITRLVDAFVAIPYLVLAISVAAVMGRSGHTILLALGLTGWPPLQQSSRARFHQLKKAGFVEAAAALGYSRRRIVFRHVLPNALQPLVVQSVFGVGRAVVADAALSFLQAGPVDPAPAWGLMVFAAKDHLESAPYELLFPAGAIVVTALAWRLTAAGLRDALDPEMTYRS